MSKTDRTIRTVDSEVSVFEVNGNVVINSTGDGYDNITMTIEQAKELALAVLAKASELEIQ